MRIVIGVEIDKNCLGCMWSDVVDDDTSPCCLDTSLYCLKSGEVKKDEDCCGEWDLKDNLDDIEHLNPVFKGEI